MHGNATPLRQEDSKFGGTVGPLEYRPWPVLFGQCAARRLTWWPEIGVGYYPVETGSQPYDSAYFERFEQQANSDIGRALMDARVAMVGRHWTGGMVDVGIGSGAFIQARMRAGHKPTLGFDVNPMALAWLSDRDLFCDPYVPRVPAISLWDVLEHIPDFPVLLANVTQWMFVSIPIFSGPDHVLRSKHYRKDEHCWYFTAAGLIEMMKNLGFECAEHNDMETKIGREDIGSFAFHRA